MFGVSLARNSPYPEELVILGRPIMLPLELLDLSKLLARALLGARLAICFLGGEGRRRNIADWKYSALVYQPGWWNRNWRWVPGQLVGLAQPLAPGERW